MNGEVQKIIDGIYSQLTGPGATPLPPSDQKAMSLGLTAAGLALSALLRIADACERSAAAAEGVRPAHDPLDGL